MKFIIGICLIALNSSCKKDLLKDEKAIFIGKWEWNYSLHQFGWCDGESWEETLTPITENTTFELEFLQQGIVNFYKDGQFQSKYRLKFLGFESYSPTSAYFGIDLNNEKGTSFDGYIFEDTILLTGFTNFIFESELGCEQYQNYFMRE